MEMNVFKFDKHIPNNSVESNITLDILHMMTTLSKEVTSRNIPLFLFLGLISLIGTVGNFLVLYVYGFLYKESNSRNFIMCLAIVDLWTCVCGIPLELFTVWDVYQFDTPWACKLSRFTNAATSVSSAALLLLIAIYRFRKICRPLQWQFSNIHAKLLSLGAIFVGLFLSWPSLVLKGVKSTTVSFGRNLTGTRTKCSNDDKYSNTRLPLIYGLVFLVLFVIALILVIIFLL